MGTGVFLTLGHQQTFYRCFAHSKLHNDYKLRNHPCAYTFSAPVQSKIASLTSLSLRSQRRSIDAILGKALVRLVSVDSKCCHSYISDLSTWYSARGLTSLCYERSHLTVGFVLICFQHLSAWNTATGRLPLAR